MESFGKVAVLAGGFSGEREVSLAGGRAVHDALRSRGVDARLFDPREQSLALLPEQGFDLAFNVLHGGFGEDGVVQGALEALGIPYTGSGVAASAISMDKFRTRLVWAGFGLPNVPCEVLRAGDDFAAVEARLGLPLFVKPACEGSSLGVVKVKKAGETVAAYDLARAYRGDVLAEKAITGGEYACAVLGERALPAIKIIPGAGAEFYDYEAKYNRDDTIYQCPCDLSREDEAKMQDLALRAFAALGCRDWGRVDFLRDEDGSLYLLEINTVPGMTSHSLVPKAARQVGIEFADLCMDILRYAATR